MATLPLIFRITASDGTESATTEPVHITGADENPSPEPTPEPTPAPTPEPTPEPEPEPTPEHLLQHRS